MHQNILSSENANIIPNAVNLCAGEIIFFFSQKSYHWGTFKEVLMVKVKSSTEYRIICHY